MAQRNPRRSVIARLLASAVLGIHTRRGHYRLQRRTEQQEIDPHASVLAERVVVYPYVYMHSAGWSCLAASIEVRASPDGPGVSGS
jgi:hypothetical protein